MTTEPKPTLKQLQEQMNDLTTSVTSEMAELRDKLQKDSVITSCLVILTSWMQGGRIGDFDDYADAVLKEYTDLSKDTIDRRKP